MYYIVKHDGKTYVNKEIVKHLHKIGDAGIAREVTNGELKAESFMGIPLYVLSASEVKQLDPESMGIVVQEPGKVIKAEIAPSHVDCKLLCKVNPDCEEFELDGLHFVRLSDILYAKKYQCQPKLPIIDVTGVRFVALEVIKKDCDLYISK